MRAFLTVVVSFVLFILYIRYLEHRALFVPSRDILATPDSIGLVYEELTITTEDNVDLNAWLIRVPGAKATMILCHGNAGNMGDRLFKLDLLRRIGVNTLIFDYRGYGKSGGRPSEAGIYKDARAVYDYLKTREDHGGSAVLAYGTSLGGAVAVDLAVNRALDGLIIDSSFTSAADMARRHFPFVPAFLIAAKLDSIGKIRQVKVPLLFFHSAQDEVVPYALGRKLYEAANEPKTFVQLIGTHNEGLVASENILEKEIKRFLERHQWL